MSLVLDDATLAVLLVDLLAQCDANATLCLAKLATSQVADDGVKECLVAVTSLRREQESRIVVLDVS